MGQETTLFTSKEQKTRAETGAFLRALADRIDVGQIVLRRAGEETVLDLADQVVLQLKAEDEEKGGKGTQHSLKIELKWYDGTESPGTVELG